MTNEKYRVILEYSIIESNYNENLEEEMEKIKGEFFGSNYNKTQEEDKDNMPSHWFG